MVPATTLKAINRGLHALDRPPSCSGWTCLFTFEPIETKADIFLFPKQLSEPKSIKFTQRNEETKSTEKQKI